MKDRALGVGSLVSYVRVLMLVEQHFALISLQHLKLLRFLQGRLSLKTDAGLFSTCHVFTSLKKFLAYRVIS